jgi:hypothetical protein
MRRSSAHTGDAVSEGVAVKRKAMPLGDDVHRDERRGSGCRARERKRESEREREREMRLKRFRAH